MEAFKECRVCCLLMKNLLWNSKINARFDLRLLKCCRLWPQQTMATKQLLELFWIQVADSVSEGSKLQISWVMDPGCITHSRRMCALAAGLHNPRVFGVQQSSTWWRIRFPQSQQRLKQLSQKHPQSATIQWTRPPNGQQSLDCLRMLLLLLSRGM